MLVSNRDASPSDLTDAAADAWEASEFAYAIAQAEDALDRPESEEGPAEYVAARIVAFVWLCRAERASVAVELEAAEEAYQAARRALDGWRLEAGCEDWLNCDWQSAEVRACLEAEEALTRARLRQVEAQRARTVAKTKPAAERRKAG